jgi:hypothetical protein
MAKGPAGVDADPFIPFALTKRKKDIEGEVRAVTLAGRRSTVCRNRNEFRKDAAARAAILAAPPPSQTRLHCVTPRVEAYSRSPPQSKGCKIFAPARPAYIDNSQVALHSRRRRWLDCEQGSGDEKNLTLSYRRRGLTPLGLRCGQRNSRGVLVSPLTWTGCSGGCSPIA